MVASRLSNGRSKASPRLKQGGLADLLGAPPPNGDNGRAKAAQRSANGKKPHPRAVRPAVKGDDGSLTTFVTASSPSVNGDNGGWTAFVAPGTSEIGDDGWVILVVGCGQGCCQGQALAGGAGDGKADPSLTRRVRVDKQPPQMRQAKDGDNGRDVRGRFVKGNAGGPGNPFNRRLAAMRAAMSKCVTKEDIRDLTGVLLAKARDGDLMALKLVFMYSIGRPTDAVNPDTLDHEEYSLFKQSAVPADLLDLVNRIPHWLICQLFRAVGPAMADARIKEMAEVFRQPAS